jgi:hypothetical protein
MRLTPRSGVSLHKILLKTVMRAPQSFFDETDSGITLNRFSQDMSLIDGQLPSSSVMAFWSKPTLPSSTYRKAKFIRRNELSGSASVDSCGINLHGHHLSHPSHRSLLSTKLLPTHIPTDAISRLGVQKSFIHPFFGDYGGSFHNPSFWLARAFHGYSASTP